MAEEVGALRVSVRANAAEIESDLGKVKSIVNSAANQIARSGTAMAKGLNSAVGEIFNLRNAAIGLAGGAFMSLIKRSVDFGDSIGEVAEMAGVSSKSLQELRYAMGLAGVKGEEADKSIMQLSKRLGEAQLDINEASKALGRLGISMVEIKDKKADEVIKMIADRIKLIPDPMARAAIVTDLFGKAGQKLLPTLMQGSEQLIKLAAEAHKMGLVLSDDTIKKASDANDEFDRLSAAMKAAGVNISVGMLPALADLRKLFTSGDFQQGVQDVAKSFGDLITWMVNNKETILAVTAAFVGFRLGRAFGPAGAVIGAGAGAFLGWQEGADLAASAVERLDRKILSLEQRIKEWRAVQAGDLWNSTGDDPAKRIEQYSVQLAAARVMRKKLADEVAAEPKVDPLTGQIDGLVKKLAKLEEQSGALRNSMNITDTAPRDWTTGPLMESLNKYQAEIEKTKAKIDELKAKQGQATATPSNVPQLTITPFSLEVAKAIEDISFKTRVLRGDFDNLAPGFAELGRGMKVFGTDAKNTVTDVSGLPLQLQALNDAMLAQQAAKVLDQIKSSTERYNEQLARLQQLHTAGKLSADEFGRAVMGIKMPALTRAIDDATNMRKQFDDFSVHSLNSTADALTDIATGAATAQEAFKKLAQSVIRDLIQMTIRALIFRSIAGIFGGGGPNSVGGGVFGDFRPGLAGGGEVRGPGSGTSDSIFARLSDGEYVVNARATREHLPWLKLINSGEMSRFAAGGTVGTPAAVARLNSRDDGRGSSTQVLQPRVVVNNYVAADVSQRTNEDGDLELTLRAVARDEMASNRTNGIQRQKYGQSPQLRMRG